MTCKTGLYCSGQHDCTETACPGHPGQHCPDLRARTVNASVDDAFNATAWMVICILLVIAWPVLAWLLSFINRN